MQQTGCEINSYSELVPGKQRDPVGGWAGIIITGVVKVFGNPSAPEVCIDSIEIGFLLGFAG